MLSDSIRHNCTYEPFDQLAGVVNSTNEREASSDSTREQGTDFLCSNVVHSRIRFTCEAAMPGVSFTLIRDSLFQFRYGHRAYELYYNVINDLTDHIYSSPSFLILVTGSSASGKTLFALNLVINCIWRKIQQSVPNITIPKICWVGIEKFNFNYARPLLTEIGRRTSEIDNRYETEEIVELLFDNFDVYWSFGKLFDYPPRWDKYDVIILDNIGIGHRYKMFNDIHRRQQLLINTATKAGRSTKLYNELVTMNQCIPDISK